MTMSAKQPQKKKSTTLPEFLRWLYLRSKLRRRYSRDNVRRTQKIQRWCAIGFALLMTVLLSGGMTYTRLYYASNPDIISLPSTTPSQPIGNPSLAQDALTYDVTVTIGTGTPVHWITSAMTVADVLDDIGYTPCADDLITPAPETVVTEDTEITVVLVTYEESEEIAAIPYSTDYLDVQTIPRGKTARVSYGVEGVARQLQRRRYENGVLADTEVLSSETVTAPVNEVLQRGVGGVVSGKHGSFNYSYYIDVTATAYGDYDEPRLTYSGTLAQEGVIAVDPTVIPLGTKVYVKGDYGDYGYCSADDIGSGIKGYHIDIFMECSREEMLQFGIRKMRVYILD